MLLLDNLTNELSELCGIAPEYRDIFGSKHITPIETKRAILKAMRLKIDSVEDVEKEINERKSRPWNRFIEPVKIISVNNQPLAISVYMPVEEGQESSLSISWYIEDENGQKDEFRLSGDEIVISAQQWINSKRYIKIDLVCNPEKAEVKKIRGWEDKARYPIGYYSINVTCTHPAFELTGTSKIIITPDSCYMPPELEGEKTWGLSINLYSIRSKRNWGVGDFADLKEIVKWVSELKGGFVGINPLHAIPNKKPFGISPYSPITRLYKNFIYLDIGSIPEVKELMANSSWLMAHGEEIKKQINELREKELIDYEKVASIKEKILRQAFEVFYEKTIQENLDSRLRGNDRIVRGNDRIEEFKRYISGEGRILESFATYMAISNSFTHSPIHPVRDESLNGVHPFTDSPKNWQEWPEEYRTPSSHAVQEFKKTHEKEILFYSYIQWLIDEQLKEIAEQSRMPIGLYHDLAIGSIGGGGDAWMAQDVIATDVNVGAPPDDFNPNGQNWGFPPIIPERLKETGYELFIQTIRKNMKHFGALRIDHALGMFRQFWIPKRMPASHGAYVMYPSEDLLRIIALESVRNRTMVIAEDLGTIGENVRESLLRFNMLSYRLLYFERNYPDPSFLSPEEYPDMALCAVTTHDLPTIYGWWSGRDIEVKKRLEIYPDGNAIQKDISNRERDKALLLEALLAHSSLLMDANKSHELSAMSHELCLAIYEYLAHTLCKLLAVSLDDIIGTLDQQNMPGVTDMYPNWMQKTPLRLEEIITNRCFNGLSEMFKRHNR
jgi:4-alpha-glucanotransferase